MLNDAYITPPIRVMIVDDHELLRLGLKVILEEAPGVQLVGEASDGNHAVTLMSEQQPDVILMDISMPEMDGINATRSISKQYKNARIIILSNYTDGTFVRAALEAGAISYLRKDISREGLIRAIRDAYVGKPTLASIVAQELIETLRNPEDTDYKLSPAEQEILKAVAHGLSNVQIANKLVVSTSTVKKHVSSILTKLKVNNRAEASAWAVRHNMVDQ